MRIAAAVLAAVVACSPPPAPDGRAPSPPARPLPPEDATANVVMVGDIMTWDRMKPALEEHGNTYPFAATAGLLRSADVAVGNLEGPIAIAAELRDDLRYPYKVPPWTLGGLRWAGIDLVSLANNHLHDCGSEGVQETMHHLISDGLDHFGAGDRDRLFEPKLVRVNGIEIAFVGVLGADALFHDHEASLDDEALERNLNVTRLRHAATWTRPGLVVATAESVRKLIVSARAAADVVVLYAHWGIRYHRPPSPYQRRLARVAINAGADLVVGHHAHIWQPIEVYRGKPIVYGLGNFAFGSRNSLAEAGLIVNAHIERNRVARIDLHPLHTNNREVRYQSQPMRGEPAHALLDELAAASDCRLAIEDDRAVLHLPRSGRD